MRHASSVCFRKEETGIAFSSQPGAARVWFWIGTHEDYNNVIKQLR